MPYRCTDGGRNVSSLEGAKNLRMGQALSNSNNRRFALCSMLPVNNMYGVSYDCTMQAAC